MASADKAYKDEYQSARQAASHEKYESYQRYQAYRESYAARYGQARPAEKKIGQFQGKRICKRKGTDPANAAENTAGDCMGTDTADAG